MKFKIDTKQIELKRREYILSEVFISIILIIGTIGIIGPKPSMVRIVAAMGFALFFILFIKYLLTL